MIAAERFAIEGVLDESTFDVPAGALALLAGPTGSGKTLLLRALAGLPTPPTRGSLCVAGRDPLAETPESLARDVALVFQDASERLPRPDVESSLAFRLENLGVPPEVGRPLVGAALARLGLAGDRAVHELSEGEAKLVALEAALAAAPRVLLLDEPLASLDARARRFVARRLAERGATTVLVAEHRARELAPHADRTYEVLDRRVVPARWVPA